MMTFAKLNKIIEENHIPHDVKLMSDSGWECGATDMDGVFYNREKNEIVFTQSTMRYDYDDNLKDISYGDGYVALTHCLASWEK
jgi:hypothetical protein